MRSMKKTDLVMLVGKVRSYPETERAFEVLRKTADMSFLGFSVVLVGERKFSG